MSQLEPLVPVRDLCLGGLFARMDLVERLKEIVRPNEEEAAALATESEVKKAIGEHMQAVSSSSATITSKEKTRAKAFLEAQLKAAEADPSAKGAEVRISKLKELLQAVQSASAQEDASHVKKARQILTKSEQEFQEIHKSYEQWEKGKKMLSVDELNKLKRSHEDLKQKVEAARLFVELQLERRPEAAADPPAALGPARGAVAVATAKIAAKATGGRGGGPGVRTAGVAAGGGGYSAPPPAAIRQAQIVAQVRSEVEAPQAAPAPRPRPQPKAKPEEEQVVLSYGCTVQAVAEIRKITQDQARDLASCSREFAEHLSPQEWEAVKERSVAIEKAQKEQQREAERKKQERLLAKATEKQLMTAHTAATAKPAVRPAQPTVKAAAPAAGAAPASKAKAKAKSVMPKAGLESLATGNRFGGFADDSDDDGGGWTMARR